VILDHQEFKDHRDLKVILDHKVFKDHRDLKVILDHQEFKDLWVILDLKGLWVQ
jgi:hypothetical protein